MGSGIPVIPTDEPGTAPAVAVVPVPAPVAVHEPAPRSREKEPRPVCEFCDCTLTADGEIIKVSETAKKFRRQTDTIESLRADLDAANADLVKARQEIAELKRATVDKPRSGIFGG